MDSAGSIGGSTYLAAAYETTMAQRSLNQQRLQGAQAVQLIEGASTPPAPASVPLPANSTFSVRV